MPFRLPSVLRGLGLLPVLAVTVVLAPLLPVPLDSVRWHGAQAVAVEVGSVVLVMALLCRPWPKSFGLPPSLRQASMLCLHGLLLWALVSCARDPNPFAVQSLLTLALGVLIADVAAVQVTDQRRMTFLISALLLSAALACGSGLAGLGNAALPIAAGALHDHQLFGAFMIIPLLLSLALSFGAATQTLRLAGQAALLVCLAGLWESQNRSAWLGMAAALPVFAGASFFTRQPRTKRVPAGGSRAGMISAALVLAAVLGIIWLSPDRARVLARAEAAGGAGPHDSLHWREQVWTGTRQMIREQPLSGWGIGSYPTTHAPFTHTGHSAASVQANGPSIEDEAHDSYLQLWAELGVVGLGLWLAALASFLAAGIAALKRFPARSLPQWALIGCLSAIAGQMTDALANPAWQFANIALPLWIVLGLTAALTRPVEAVHKHAHQPTYNRPARIGQTALAAGAGAGLLWLIFKTAFALPAPHL